MNLILLFSCLLILTHVNAHKVWTWLQGDDKVLWNRHKYDSVEQSCYNFGSQPVNYAAMCTVGSYGRKCISLYSDYYCKGEQHEESHNKMDNYCKDGADNFDLISDFDIKFKSDFWAYSAKTYNC